MRKLSGWRPSQLPIRQRLTLWYLASLTAILLLLAAFLYWQVRRSLLDGIDVALERVAAQALANVAVQEGRLAFRTVASSPSRLGDEFAVYLLAEDGAALAKLGQGQEIPAVAPQPGLHTYSDGDDTWRVYSERVTPAGQRVTGWLQVIQSLEPVTATLAILGLQLAWGLPLAWLLAGAGGYWLAGRALRPVQAMTQTAQAIGASDLHQRMGYNGPTDELGQLAVTFDLMLERLQAAFERERRFTGDAAHELRTPLTALKGRLEVTLSRPRQTAEYVETLQEMEQQVDRLIRLSNDLLFLARLDQRQLQLRREPVELGELLGVVVEQMRPLWEAKALALHQTIAKGLAIQGDFDLLTRLFLNLLDNAIKYTPAGGQIGVQARLVDRQVSIAIRDSGPGIAAEHLPHLFERFYRVEADRARRPGEPEPGGAGLGLAIAYEIARAHGGGLMVKSEIGRGTSLAVVFPPSP
ncbi:MAG: HAMP domain-containing sensor histidine kinase [Chloroflexota bacterium]